jgi:hypothetical protein
MKNKFYILIALVLFTAAVYFLWPLNSSTTISQQSEKIKTTSGALESMQFLTQIRAFPEKDIPQDKFFMAFEHSKNNMQDLSSVTDNSPSQWTSIGPNNVGGRSLCIEFSPTDTATLYIGSASGGLWKSVTGGLGANAWTYIETGFPSLAVSSIAIDSANPNIMYIGTGENYGYQYSLNGLDVRVTRGMYGIGILKTTNGGLNWTKSLDWSYNNQRGVWKVLFNPKNRNVLYAATSEGVWRSNNAGVSWFQQLNHNMVMDMEINPADTSVVYISVGNLNNNVPNPNLGIYKTTNSGAVWNKLTGGLPASWTGKTTIELYKGNPNFINASVSNDFSYVGYYTSTNAGANWTQRSTTVPIGNQGWYNNAHIIKPDNANVVLVGSLDLYKSTNGGTSFATKSNWSAWNEGPTPPGQPESAANNFAHADHHFFAANPRDANKLYCITDGGLYRSNDFGETYYSCNGGYVTTQFYNGFSNSMQDSNYCLGGLQDNRAVFYQGTTAWYKTFFGDGMWSGINSQNDNICYMEYTSGDINKSVDGGINWNDISGGLSGQFCFVTPYIVCRSNPNIMYIAGSSIFRSTIGGGGWSNVGTFNSKALSMDASATGTDTIYVGVIPVSAGQPATIYRSINGTTFTNISNTQLPSAYPTDMHVNPNNSADVYVTMGGFGSGHVYRSQNAGVTWINISGNLPDVPHQSIVIDPQYPQNIYVGNDLGVYVSTNSGVNWFEFRTGMPYALVFDVTIVYPSRNIRAVTHGNGVYERDLIQNPVGINPVGNNIPKEFSLGQNYPNPFNPSAKIKFDVSKQANVRITVYDISGRLVTTLVNENLKPASYEIKFDGSGLSSGVYFYKLETEGFVDTKKMLMVK